jgi:chromosome segregation ATPase
MTQQISGRPAARLSTLLALAIVCLGLGACQRAYYGTMEAFGVHKREILVDRVESARGDQTEAKEEFQTALQKFSDVVNFQGGNLEAKYEELKSQLDRCENKASNLRSRIKSIESVAEALFREWETELEEYASADLRRRSEESLRDTSARYDKLVSAMYRAERKMEPVLAAFRDQVLYLKHNLNAQAIASLQGEVVTLESNVAELIAEMERAIAEADSFIQNMG